MGVGISSLFFFPFGDSSTLWVEFWKEERETDRQRKRKREIGELAYSISTFVGVDVCACVSVTETQKDTIRPHSCPSK